MVCDYFKCYFYALWKCNDIMIELTMKKLVTYRYNVKLVYKQVFIEVLII